MTQSAALLLGFLWAVGVACASSLDGDAARLLLVMGDVTRTAARVLIDAPQPARDALSLRVFRSANEAETDGNGEAAFVLDRRVVVDVSTGGSSRPRAVQLDELRPATRYVVEFLWGDDSAGAETAATGDQYDRVRFRTAPDGKEQEGETRVLAVSCDRFVDDHDDELMVELAQDVEWSPTHFGVAHIGDQVYVDAGDARIPVDPLPVEKLTDGSVVAERYLRLVDAFRGVYRATFGRPVLQRVLRVGAHWMLPDDHEVINNLNRERVTRAFQGWTNTSLPRDERALLFELTLHYRAGLQVFYEFQYQLQRDVPWSSVDFLSQPLDEIVRALPMHFSVQVGALRLFFLDARFDRAFLTDGGEHASNSRLIGPAQRDALVTALQTWRQERDEGRKVVPVVLSNFPLFFHSSLSAGIAYVVEKETYPGLAEQRSGLEDLFELLIGQADTGAPSDPPVVRLLVGGDVHMMAHSRVCDSTASRCVDQLITSGVTNGSTAIEDVKLVPFYVLITRLTPAVDFVLGCLTSLVPQSVTDIFNAVFHRAPWRIYFDWVFLGRNYGVLEVARDGKFQWRQTVVSPQDGARRQLLQGLFDTTSTPWHLALALLVVTLLSAVIATRVARWAFMSKQPKHKDD